MAARSSPRRVPPRALLTYSKLGGLVENGKFCDIAVALHSQQGRLAYLCEAKTLPVENPVEDPLHRTQKTCSS